MAEIGLFELGERLGEGGMGVVYRGRHGETGIEVALKIIRRSLGGAEHRKKIVRREVQAHASLIHPDIVYLYEYGEVPERAAAQLEDVKPGDPYVAMELADEGSVRDLMPIESWETTRQVLIQVLDALAYSHARRIVHRDLKPENLLVFDGEQRVCDVKLADFGLVHAVGEEHDRATATLSTPSGTPRYMSPEQSSGRWRMFGPWTDLYAVGCIAWELVSGRPPFLGNTPLETMTLHRRNRRPPLDARFPIPDGLEAWIHRAMAIEPSNRFRKAADASRQLDALRMPEGDAGSSLAGRVSDEADLVLAPTLAKTRASVAPTADWSGGEMAAFDSSEDEAIRAEPSASKRPSGPPRPAVPEKMGADHSRWLTSRIATRPARLVGTGLGLFELREPPFVDRKSECKQIWERLRTVDEERELRVVVVEGPSGSGKSRLAERIATRADELGAANVLKVVHTAGGGGPLEGLTGMIRRVVRGFKLDRSEFYEHLLDHLPPLEGSGVDRQTDAAGLTELVFPTDESAESIDGPRYRFSSSDHKHALVSRFLRRYSTRRPVILRLEDIQWEEATLEFLEHLVRQSPEEAPMLVLATLRSEALGRSAILRERIETLHSYAELGRLDIGPLEPEHHRRYIERLLPLDDETASKIADRTEGNPLFAAQVLGDLVERDGLEADSDGFRVADGVSLDVPPDIRQLWIRRLRRLADTLEEGQTDAFWRAIEFAAALGREVDGEEWMAVCREVGLKRPDVIQNRLAARGLAERTESGWRFRHGLLVESLEQHARSAGRWKHHHRRCVRILQELYPNRSGQTAARRADHWQRAGEWERALAPLKEMYERHVDLGSIERGRRALERRAELLDEIGAGHEDHRRIENELNLAACRINAGADPEVELEIVQEARDRAARAGDDALVAEGWTLEAWCRRKKGSYEMARTSARRATKAARRSGEKPQLVRALTIWGWSSYYLGDLDSAEERFLEAGDEARADGNRYREMESRQNVAWVAVARGHDERAADLFEGLLEEAREAGFRGLEARCANGLGELARYGGEVDRARACYRRYGEVNRELRRPASVAVSVWNRTQVELMAGNFEAAADRLREAERRFEELSRREEYEHYLRLARIVRAAGRSDWERFDALFAPYSGGWPEDARRFKDHPWLLEMAGDYADERDARERAERAWRLAQTLWRDLDDEMAARRVGRKLDDE